MFFNKCKLLIIYRASFFCEALKAKILLNFHISSNIEICT